ncbi:hypothetical protein ACSBR1_020917 [Camellia fascicularis]
MTFDSYLLHKKIQQNGPTQSDELFRSSSSPRSLSLSLSVSLSFHAQAMILHSKECFTWFMSWKTVQKELWSSVMSPYEDRYVDVKFVDKIASYVMVTVDKEFQRWRLFCLAFGFVLLLFAPVVSSWVPFYYSNSMAVGVFLVIIILLFQELP